MILLLKRDIIIFFLKLEIIMLKNINFFILLFINLKLLSCGPAFFNLDYPILESAKEKNIYYTAKEPKSLYAITFAFTVKQLLEIHKENNLDACTKFIEKLPDDLKNPLMLALLKTIGIDKI